MQVAKQNMPVSSIVVGVDLFPIKPIPGTIGLVEDITTDKCKSSLTKELQSWKADVVLHDGAPNVGKNWLFDAYQQICLTLQSLKLATNFLRKGGWFITKVFRSKDYNALLWVLKQLFKKVHATKPSASRKESAEIFVVCQGYIAPDKIDPKFMDPKYVFEELELDGKQVNLLNVEKQKRIKAEGYSESELKMRHELMVSDFIKDETGLTALQGISEIMFDDEFISKHPRTTSEIKECCKDLKVLGRKDLRIILTWWKHLREELYPKDKPAEEAVVEKKPLTLDEAEDKEFEEIEQHIADVELEDKQDAKRKKKKVNKMRTKLSEKMNLKMILKGDEGPHEEADDMFELRDVGNKKNLDILDDQNPDTLADSDEDEETITKKFSRYDKYSSHLDKNGLVQNDDRSDSEDDKSESDESDLGKEGLGFSDDEDDGDSKDKKKGKKGTKEPDALIVRDLDNRTKDIKRKQRVQLWFEKDTLKSIEKDDDEDADLDKLADEYKKKGVKVLGNTDDDIVVPEMLGKKAKRRARHAKDKEASSSEESSDDEYNADDMETEQVKETKKGTKENKHAGNKKVGGKAGFEVVSAEKAKKFKLNEEELALGSLMIRSKKVKRDLTDAAWNRYTFNDDNLPDWFVKDEEINMKREVPTPRELVEEYKAKMEELNTRPIKKVMEAKARKKRQTMKRMEKAKKKAEHILENADSSSQEKTRQLKK